MATILTLVLALQLAVCGGVLAREVVRAEPRYRLLAVSFGGLLTILVLGAATGLGL